MFLQLAYADAGHQPPDGELYAVGGELEGPEWRDGVKQLSLAMLSAPQPLKTDSVNDTAKCLPKGLSCRRRHRSSLDAHPLIAGSFGCGKGYG